MYQEYLKDSFKIILTLIDGKCPCISIHFDVFNYNYVMYGPKENPIEWLHKYSSIFANQSNYSIEYCTTYVKLKHDNQTQIVDRVEYPMNYILKSMERINKLEELVSKLINL